MPVTALAGLHGGAALALGWCVPGAFLHRNEDAMVLYPFFGAGFEPCWCMEWHGLCFSRAMKKRWLFIKNAQPLKRVMLLEGGSKLKAQSQSYLGMKVTQRAEDLSFSL